MEIINLGEQKSVLNQYIIEIRDQVIQKDSMKFRKNLERIGEFIACEISKRLDYTPIEVTTPLGIAQTTTYENNIVIASILRAGIPLHDGILNVFDRAQNAFIGAYRKYGKDNKFNIEVEYASAPRIDGKVLILADTMLATGASLVLAYERLLKNGTPKHTHIVSTIASADGVEYLKKHITDPNVTLWLAAVAAELTNKSYIVPGLGDAGDLAYGSKL